MFAVSQQFVYPDVRMGVLLVLFMLLEASMSMTLGRDLACVYYIAVEEGGQTEEMILELYSHFAMSHRSHRAILDFN